MPPPLSLSLPSPQPLSLLPRHAKAPQSLSLSCPISIRAQPSSVCSVVPARHSDYFDPRAAPPLPPQRDAYGQPPLEREAPAQGSQIGRVFASYNIYKGKAALAFDPRPPQFMPLESGAYKVAKEGFVLLQFAPAVGPRQYDWARKQPLRYGPTFKKDRALRTRWRRITGSGVSKAGSDGCEPGSADPVQEGAVEQRAPPPRVPTPPHAHTVCVAAVACIRLSRCSGAASSTCSSSCAIPCSATATRREGCVHGHGQGLHDRRRPLRRQEAARPRHLEDEEEGRARRRQGQQGRRRWRGQAEVRRRRTGQGGKEEKEQDDAKCGCGDNAVKGKGGKDNKKPAMRGDRPGARLYLQRQLGLEHGLV